jgi:hypothetical protein
MVDENWIQADVRFDYLLDNINEFFDNYEFKHSYKHANWLRNVNIDRIRFEGEQDNYHKNVKLIYDNKHEVSFINVSKKLDDLYILLCLTKNLFELFEDNY